MEADGPANIKTQERTEGAATALQAMRGDSCTTAQRVQDGPMTNSTCFTSMAEAPFLPCRDGVVVESGDAAPDSCLPSMGMRTTTTAGGLASTGEVSTATRTASNEPLLRIYATEEMNPEEDSRRKIYGFQFHMPRTTAASFRRVTCLLLPTAGGSLRQNPGKLGLLIQAVRKVTSAPAHFWNPDARWFVLRLYVLDQPGDELQHFFRTRFVASLKQGQR